MSLNPLPFDLKKQEFDKFTEFFQKKQESNSLKESQLSSTTEESTTQNQTRLRAGRPKKKTTQKKFENIPIIAHESQKPTIVYDEINSGNKKICKRELACKNNKKTSSKNFENIPIISHDSQKPNIVYEEVNNGINKSNVKGNYKEKKSCECKNKNKSSKNYEDIPIVKHDSEKPKYVYEEISSGKLYSNRVFNKSEKTKTQNLKCVKKNLGNKKYEEIPIIEHDSILPSVTYEEINCGKKSPFCEAKTVISKGTNKKQCTKKNLNNKKYDEIPIIAHDSTKPSVIYEEIYGGKLPLSLNNNFVKKECCCKKNVCENKNEKINIIVHESMLPSIVYEEVNNGKKSTFCLPTENTNKKEVKCKKCCSNKKFNDVPVIEHDSQKPTIVYEEINSGIFK